MLTLGERIKQEREKTKISTRKLAELANISQAQISRIENNTTTPSVEIAKNLCKIFKISADYLLFGVEKNKELLEDEKKLLKGYQQLTERRKGALEDKLKDLLKDQDTESQQEAIVKQEIS